MSQVPTPGVDWHGLKTVIDAQTGGGMIEWLGVFPGGALGQCAIGFCQSGLTFPRRL
jgi:hypothetical protein